GPRQTEVGVSWNIRDDNLDLGLPDSVRVEYRVFGGANWIPLAVPLGANQVYWAPGSRDAIEVRVRARDRAGNIGEDKTTVRLGAGGGAPNFNNPTPHDPFKELQRKF